MRYKILFAGPVGAGKTTAIGAVSDTPVVRTEAKATDAVRQRKARTTVAMDYGSLTVDEQVTIQLIGTPGQERFDFMWEILSVGALGVMIMIDNAREDPLSDLDLYLKAFHRILDRRGAKGVICVTRRDLADTPDLGAYRAHMDKLDLHWPIFEVDARSRSDVKTALLALTAELNPTPIRKQTA